MPRQLLVLSILFTATLLAFWPRSASAAEANESGSAEDLRAQLVRQDRLLFDALFVECDAARANAFYTDDVEFYDDRSGLSVGDEVRESSRRLAENCPADHGVRRVLLEETVEVHPLEGYGAVEMGTHHFVERGAATSTVGRFIHTWKRVGDEWKLARIISLHETMDADLAADRRGE